MDEPGPARLYASLLGALLLLFGIIGFFYSAAFGDPGKVADALGVISVNGWCNALHVASGAVGLAVADYAARAYALWLGAFYLAIAVWGFVLGSGGAILGHLPVNGGANVLHLVVGLLGVAAALSTPPRALKARAKPAA